MKNIKQYKKHAIALVIGLSCLQAYAANTNGNTSNNIRAILQQAPNLKASTLQSAVKAYNKAQQRGLSNKPILTVIDFTMPSNEKRMWVIDMRTNRVLANDLVAHGKGSGDRYATRFSNKHQTYASSLGVYVTGATYQGRHGLSLRLHGMEKGINDQIFERTVVMHSATYVNKELAEAYGKIGRSWGCPAMSKATAAKVIPAIKNGSVVVAYHDQWKQISSFA